MSTDIPTPPHRLDVARATEFSEDDLLALCEAADAAILDGGGFGWLTPPGRTAMESYFRGVLLVPERALFVARLDGVPVGAAQLVRPARNNEAQAFSAQMMHMFIAPYARGKGLARMMLVKLEDSARSQGYQVLNLDVRETQEAAIALFRELGYERWGSHPCYARVGRHHDRRRVLLQAPATGFQGMSNFTIYPAIDLKDGACVRLRQGEMDQATIYGTDPGAQARAWQDAGAEWVHVVDLNGAFAGKPVNRDAVQDILTEVTVPVQLGGGIRDMAGIEAWLIAGVARVILGSAALKNSNLVRQACIAYPGQIVVGIDAKDGMVATEGWADVSSVSVHDLAARFADCGVAAIVYTDISRDGMLSGVNIEATLELAGASAIPVIASGGIGGIDDVRALRKASAGRLNGVIIGRALYDGRVQLADALQDAA